MAERPINRVQALFNQALELAPELRAAFLESACPDDPTLRAEVESLLARAIDSSLNTGAEGLLNSPLVRGSRDPRTHPHPGVGEANPSRIGNYSLLRLLGEGGMGLVYLAEQTNPLRQVAIKLLASPDRHPDAQERFRIEAEAIARLQHPHIVEIFEVDEHDGRPFLVLEYLEGGSLAERLTRETVGPNEAAGLIQTLARAIHFAHCQGFIHRDLKPGNVLFSGDGMAKIADFGLARAVANPSDLTLSKQILGTPAYMAPEQAQGDRLRVGPATDVYALGVILYECLTGQRPFGGESALEIMHALLHNDPVSPRRHRPSLPRDLEAICLTCLHKDPARRYPSAWELAEDLERFLKGEITRARPAGLVERATKWARRRPAAAALVAVSVAAFLALIGGGGWFTARLAQESADAREQKRIAQQERNDAVKARNEVQAQKKTADHANFQTARAGNAWHGIQIELAMQAWDRHDLVAVDNILSEVDEVFQQTWEQRYLRALCRRKALSLVGHTGPVTGVAFRRDGTWLASASQDRTIRIWDVATGRLIRTLEGHTDSVAAVCFSPDGRQIFSGGHDRTVRVWDTETGRLIQTLEGHTQPVTRVAVSDDGKCLVTGSGNCERPGEIKVWDAQARTERFTRGFGEAHGESLALSPDGKRFSAGVGPRRIKVWDTEAGREVCNLLMLAGTLAKPAPDFGHLFPVCSTAFRRDGKVLVSACTQGRLLWWEVPSNQGRRLECPNLRRVTNLQVTAAGQRLVFTADTERVVRVLDTTSGQQLFSLAGHAGKINALAVSFDEKRIASGGDDRIVKVWDVETPRATALAGLDTLARRTAVSADGQRCVVGHANGRVSLWNIGAGREVWGSAPDQRQIAAVALSADGGVVASVNMIEELQVWKDSRARTLGRVGNINPKVVLSPDGLRVVTSDNDKPLTVWDADSGKVLFTLNQAASLGFEPTGHRLLVAQEGQVKLIDADTGATLRELAGPTREISCAAFENSGKRLVTGGADGVLRIWDAETGQQKLASKSRSGALNGVAFGGDGRWLVSGSSDGTIRIWDVETLQEKLVLNRTPPALNGMFSIAISNDDTRILVCGDGTVNLWEAERMVGEPPRKGNTP